MTKTELETKIDEKLSIRQLALHFVVSPTTVRYWLKQYGLETQHKRFNKGWKPLGYQVNPSGRFCPQCEKVKPLAEFYKRHSRADSLSGWCKGCCIDTAKLRMQENKRRAVEDRGGKCSSPDCGYDRCIAALEFHHLDPAKKDPKWKGITTAGWDSLQAELAKCVLVCANCHREIHAGVRTL